MSASENRPQEPQETGSIWAQSYRNIEWSHAATAPRYWPAISELVKYEHTVSMTIRFLLHRIGALLSIIFGRNDVAGDGSVEMSSVAYDEVQLESPPIQLVAVCWDSPVTRIFSCLQSFGPFDDQTACVPQKKREQWTNYRPTLLRQVGTRRRSSQQTSDVIADSWSLYSASTTDFSIFTTLYYCYSC